jgi:sugar/nucleoside kinase (ribokinase family)
VSILAIGSVAYDDVKTSRVSRRGLLGGSATYFCGVASFFHRVKLMAPVGDDFLARDEALLRRLGIDLTYLVRVPGGKTFRWSGVYERDMNIRKTTRLDLNVFADFTPRLTGGGKECDYLYLGNISPYLQDEVLAQLSKHRPRLVVGDTMDHWIQDCPAKVKKLVSKLDLLLTTPSGAVPESGLR